VNAKLYLDPTDGPGIEDYARRAGILGPDEPFVGASRAGNGNMNLTLRLETGSRSVILKQARPWVEKYPHIPAPADRALVEIAFYETVRQRPAVREAMPALLDTDPGARVLVLEDLGAALDLTSIYAGPMPSSGDIDTLGAYLRALHEPWPSDSVPALFANREMRRLNHEHIFRLPLVADNGIDLDAITPGLATVSKELTTDRAYVDRVTELGALYLEDGDRLLHGDFFPGSWLSTPNGVRVIDPEFGFLGPPAFDVGVMLAHFRLAAMPDDLARRSLDVYGPTDETLSLARGFAGVEIMRRLVGVAQLPIDFDLERKQGLLELSKELVLHA